MKPTLNEGELEYWSNTSVSVPTFTNAPRAKNTPSVTVNAEPVAVALLRTQVAKSDPLDVVVDPKVKSDSVTKFSPSANTWVVWSFLFVFLYLLSYLRWLKVVARIISFVWMHEIE